jgi:hypothetical protein
VPAGCCEAAESGLPLPVSHLRIVRAPTIGRGRRTRHRSREHPVDRPLHRPDRARRRRACSPIRSCACSSPICGGGSDPSRCDARDRRGARSRTPTTTISTSARCSGSDGRRRSSSRGGSGRSCTGRGSGTSTSSRSGGARDRRRAGRGDVRRARRLAPALPGPRPGRRLRGARLAAGLLRRRQPNLFRRWTGLVPDLDLALIPIWGWGPSLGRGEHLDPRAPPRRSPSAPRRPPCRSTGGPTRRSTSGSRAVPAYLAEPQAAFSAAAARLAPGVAVRVALRPARRSSSEPAAHEPARGSSRPFARPRTRPR